MDNFILYPNPASEMVQISFPNSEHTINKVTITDALGRIVFQENFENSQGGNINIFLSQLSKGAYYVSIIDEQGKVSTKPFIKN